MAFGHWLESWGFHISEHPHWGGVTPGVHVFNSQHFFAAAIDVNWNHGNEYWHISRIVDDARLSGFFVIWQEPGHYDHAHIAIPR